MSVKKYIYIHINVLQVKYITYLCAIYSSRDRSVHMQTCWTHVQYTPSVSTIKRSGPTYSSQNVRQIWESTLSKSDYLVGYFGLGRTWEWILKDFFFTFLEVNMSNILWSMRICKRTFFPVCRMCEYVNTLVYFYLAPYSRQER